MPALAECFRVLEPGGELRIIVPDAGRYIRAYAHDDTEFFDAMRELGGAVTPFETDIEIVNQAFRMGGDHQFAWDLPVMRRRLEQVGFERVEETGYDPDRFIDQGDEWRRRESLYVVAYKPRVAAGTAGSGAHGAGGRGLEGLTALPAAASRCASARSPSTIIRTSSLKLVRGAQPNAARAFVASPSRRSTSAGRIVAWVDLDVLAPIEIEAAPPRHSRNSRTECVSPVAIT